MEAGPKRFDFLFIGACQEETMAEDKSHNNIDENNLTNGHLINNGLDGKHEVFTWLDSIDLGQSERAVVVVGGGLDPVGEHEGKPEE